MASDGHSLADELSAQCIEAIIAQREALAELLRRLNITGLPSSRLDTPEVASRLPDVSSLYFLTHEEHGLLYVGRAISLTRRWEVPRNMYQQRMWDLAHAWLWPCYRLGNVRLSWWEIPRNFIEELESAAIKVLHPRLNERSRSSARGKQLAQELYEIARIDRPPVDEPIGAREERSVAKRFAMRFSRSSKPISGTLAETDIQRLATAAKRTGRNPHRDATIILFLFRHALKLSQLSNLRWDDIDFDEGEVFIPARRGGRDSIHVIEGDELRALRKLRREYPNACFVFMSERGAPLSAAAVQMIVKRASQRAGFEGRVTPRALVSSSPIQSHLDLFRDFVRML